MPAADESGRAAEPLRAAGGVRGAHNPAFTDPNPIPETCFDGSETALRRFVRNARLSLCFAPAGLAMDGCDSCMILRQGEGVAVSRSGMTEP